MRAGDTVSPKSRPDEQWVVAYVEGNWLAWFGWPEGEIKLDEVVLIESCSDAEHRKALEKWALKPCVENGVTDRRSIVCQRQLWALRLQLGELQPPSAERVRDLQAARDALSLLVRHEPNEGEFATGWNEQEQRVADAIAEARKAPRIEPPALKWIPDPEGEPGMLDAEFPFGTLGISPPDDEDPDWSWFVQFEHLVEGSSESMEHAKADAARGIVRAIAEMVPKICSTCGGGPGGCPNCCEECAHTTGGQCSKHAPPEHAER